jgi:hypothetical protein
MRLATVSVVRFASLVLLAATATSAAAAQPFKPPRTSWGDPLIQGVYTNNPDVPVERPRELGDKEFYTEAEYEARKAQRKPEYETTPGTVGDVHYANDQFALLPEQSHMVENLRTSIITRPANGRLPPLRADAQQRSNAARTGQQGGVYDSHESRPLLERCIMWTHVGPPLRPVAYNTGVQIMQSKHQVVLMTEMIHDARVIPISKSKPDFAGLTRWQGNSWGRWEADTLVIETTGISDRVNPRGSNVPLGPEGKVIEKITRTGPKTIRYEFTVSDPSLWDVAWGGEYPMELSGDPMFEYACHEGNYGMANTLSGAREEEKKARAGQ